MKRFHTLFSFLLTGTFLFSAAVLSGCKPAPAKNAGPRGGTITVTSSPSGAAIQILGKEIAVTPKTTKPVPPGMYIVKVTKDGYEPAWQPAFVGTDKNAVVDIKLKPYTAIVMLTSTPSGAKIEKDGREVGVTPLVLTDLPMGNHSVLFHCSGYSPVEKSWRAENDRPVAIHADLTSNTGMLSVNSEPQGASLLIDGNPHGVTPFESKLESGQHKIQISKDGYEIYTAIIEVKLEKKETVSAQLKLKPMEIHIASNPEKAVAFVNGKECGTTPCVYKTLVPGKYKVSAEKDRYSKSDVEVELSPGAKRDVTLTLESEVGQIKLFTVPAGVTVFLDKKEIGKTKADPKNPQISLVFEITDVLQGTHELELVHKRAKPNTSIRKTVKVEKGKTNVLSKPLELWVPNVILELKKGGRVRGRVQDLKADPVKLGTSPKIVNGEPKSTILTSYPHSEIKNIIPITDED